ncbi:MAG: hypothetical protein LLF96_05095 [Eubacteriales bacterium]|nr:hypothetical protein [Eubacteriales bacterium]
MGKARFIVQSSRSCFRKWGIGPRIPVLFGLIACLTILYAVPFAENARAQGQPLQCCEIFIALLNWRFSMLIFSSAILLLFGDLPVIDLFTGNALIRGTRRSWIASQILYIVVTSLLLAMFIFVLSMLVSLPNLSFSNVWSRPVSILARSGRVAISPERMRLPMQKSIIMDYLPWEAFGHSFILFFLMGCFYGLGSLVLKLRFRSGSLVLLMIVNAASWTAGVFGIGDSGYAILSIISVHYHTTLFLHEYVAVNPLLPTLRQSYAIMIGVIAALTLLGLLLVKQYDFTSMEDEQL